MIPNKKAPALDRHRYAHIWSRFPLLGLLLNAFTDYRVPWPCFGVELDLHFFMAFMAFMAAVAFMAFIAFIAAFFFMTFMAFIAAMAFMAFIAFIAAFFFM